MAPFYGWGSTASRLEQDNKEGQANKETPDLRL